MRFSIDFQKVKVVLIPKTIADTIEDQKYRLICLISVMRKLSE